MLLHHLRYGWLSSVVTIFAAVGCSDPGSEHEDARRSASDAYSQALTAFNAKDRVAAEQHFTAALDTGGLNPDSYVDALVKRAVCRSAAGRHDEALADLEKLSDGGGAEDQVLAARSYLLAKQGKAAEARAALAKARQYNRTVQEFKD